MYRAPEDTPEFVRITELISNLFSQVNDWAYAEFKHQDLELAVSYALDNIDISTGKVDSETAIRAAAGLIWAVLQAQENPTIMKN